MIKQVESVEEAAAILTEDDPHTQLEFDLIIPDADSQDLREVADAIDRACCSGAIPGVFEIDGEIHWIGASCGH